MGKISINNTVLEKYFQLLSSLDNSAKKKLITKLTASLQTQTKTLDLLSLFGAWEDTRDADEIITEIKESRVNKQEIEGFE